METLSLKKISRHIPRKILYPSVTKPKTVFALSPTNVWQAPNFVSRCCIHSYLSNCIFPSSPILPFFSSPFLFYPHTSFIDIFPRKDKIRAKGYTRFAVYISRFFLFHQLRTAAGGEVSLVSPLLREKEFECISTFP